MVHEIVTLQIGHYSSHVGAHLWNHLDLEERNGNTHIDYNTYYTYNKKTNIASPRALIIDYRNTFGCLLGEADVKPLENSSTVEVIQRQTDEQFWSNQLTTKAKFQSKSLVPLAGYWYTPNDDQNQFDIFSVGEQVYRTMFDSIENSLHHILESCDSLQSFRCLYDVNTSFSGLFTCIQDHLNDECPKRPMWSFGLEETPSSSPLNMALSLSHSLNENQMPTVACRSSLDSISLALAIQHALLSSTTRLDVLADRLCPMKNNLLHLFETIPLNLNHKTLHNYLESNSLFAFTDPIACHCFTRGIEQAKLYDSSLYNFNIPTAGELISAYLSEQFGSKMFVSSHSWTDKFHGTLSKRHYDRISMLAGLVNDRAASFRCFDDLSREVRKIKFKVLSKRWEENGFDEDRYEQLTNNLNTLTELYQSE